MIIDYYSNAVELTEGCCDGLATVPPTPGQPTATIDWPHEKIIVEAPSWAVGEVYADGLYQELQRSLDNVTWEGATVWNAANGTWDEAPAAAFQKYFYRVRNCNVAGCSDWSPVLLVQVVSSSVSVSWLEPLQSSQVHGVADLRFWATDSGSGISNPRIVAIPGGTVAPVTRYTGTAQNGQYRATWDTRRYYEGTITLRALVTGSDGLPAYADRVVTVANSAATWPQFRTVSVTTPVAGTEIHALRASVECGALSSADLQRYWFTLGVGTEESVVGNEDTRWQSLQKFPLGRETGWPERGLVAEGQIWAARRGLDKPASTVFATVRAEPTVAQRLWQTGYDAVTQITQIRPGLHWILARDDDAQRAGIFSYDGTTLTKLAELGTFAAGSTHAFAPALVTGGDLKKPDGVLCATATGLLLVDLNPATSPMDAAQLITPINNGAAEARPLRTVVALDDGALVIYAGGGSTQAYWRSVAGLRPVWSLLVEADHVSWDGALRVSYDQYLLTASTPQTKPTNTQMFPHAIDVVGNGLVVLDNGDLYAQADAGWEYVTTFASGNALARWRAGRAAEIPVLAGDDLMLRWPDRRGQWGDGFAIVPPAAVPAVSSRVLALGHFQVELAPVVPQSAGSDTPPPSDWDDRLLFGMDAGVFGELRMSKLSERDGAFQGTGEEAITLIPTWRVAADDD